MTAIDVTQHIIHINLFIETHHGASASKFDSFDGNRVVVASIEHICTHSTADTHTHARARARSDGRNNTIDDTENAALSLPLLSSNL